MKHVNIPYSGCLRANSRPGVSSIALFLMERFAYLLHDPSAREVLDITIQLSCISQLYCDIENLSCAVVNCTYPLN